MAKLLLVFSVVVLAWCCLEVQAGGGQAERIISSLGLDADTNQDQQLSKLVERRIDLGILGDPGSEVTLQDLGHHAGFFKLAHTHDARMFYFFFESRGSRKKDPVVLWMTGGPGCGSEIALFYENGPFKITENRTMYWNDYGWDKISNIIFVDQPVGTGYSYSLDVRDIRHDEKGVSSDIYDFLTAFFEAHPQYADHDFYVMGESYAGHYVPAVASNIHEHNKASDGIKINLKGFAIGNGLTQPDIQYQSYPDYASQMKLINEQQHASISKMMPRCVNSAKRCGEAAGTVQCVAALFICQSILRSILTITGNINYYDIRKPCIGQVCYDFSAMEDLLNSKAARQALGVKRSFIPCNPIVYAAMLADWMRNLEVGIPPLLEDNIKLLVYAGEYDLVCNWLGNSRWVAAIEWSGKQHYAQASWQEFTVDGAVAGSTSSYGPLTFTKVYNAGHMVPMDQPRNSLDMISKWMRSKPGTTLLQEPAGDDLKLMYS